MSSYDHFEYLVRRRRSRIVWTIVSVAATVFVVRFLVAQSRADWLSHASTHALEDAARVNPGDDEVVFRLSMKLAGEGRREEALAGMERLVKAHPVSAEYWFGLAKTADTSLRLQRATEAYRKALDLNPKLADAHTALGHLYTEAGLFTDGEQEFRAADALKPSDKSYYSAWAECLLNIGRAQEAWTLQSQAIRNNPGDESQFPRLVAAAIPTGHLAEAETLVRGRIQMSRMYSTAMVRGALAELILARSHSAASIREARSVAEAAFTNAGVPSDFLALYAKILILEGDLSTARRALAQGLKVSPNNIPCLEQQLHLDETSRENVGAGRCRARLAVLRHESPDVIALRLRAVAAPEDRDIGLRLATASAAAGDPARAAQECQRILRRTPSDPEAKKLLDECHIQAIHALSDRLAAENAALVAQVAGGAGH